MKTFLTLFRYSRWLIPFSLFSGLLSLPVSAQLTLNGTQLLSSPGTYSGDLVIPPETTLSVTGGGTYTLSGVISDGVARQATLLPMSSSIGTDYLGSSVTVTTSSLQNGNFSGWKSIGDSPSGEWASQGTISNFWLQVQYGIPLIITSAKLRSRLNNFESATNWRIEGSADGTSWTPLYSSTHLLPGNRITTVTWNNSIAYSYYRFYGVSSQGSSLNPGLSLFQLLGGRTPTASHLTVQAGSGQIVLTGANTYTGGTTISAGTLKIGHLAALGTNEVVINGGTTLDLRGGFSNIANTLNKNGGSLLRDDGLYLNDILLTSNAGTPYSGDLVLPPPSTLTQQGPGTYTLSGILSNGVAPYATLSSMRSATDSDAFGGTITVTTSSLQNRDFPGWKSIGDSPSGEWASQGTTSNFWLQVQYGIPLIITSAKLRSRLNNFESATNWRIEGSVNGTSWTPLYSSTHLLPGNTITTVTWNNTTAYSYYRFYGVSSQVSSLNPGLSLFQLLGNRTPSSSNLTVQAGSGQIVLTGANTYTGGTRIITGTVKIGHLSALGTNGVVIFGGATLDLRGGFSNIANALSNSGSLLRDDGLYLNGILLTTQAGTPYSGDLALPPQSTFTQQGPGTYTLSGILSDGVARQSTLLSMSSATGSDAFGGTITVTTSSLQNGNFSGWKSIGDSPSGEWASQGTSSNFWLQVQYGIPLIITSAKLRSRLNNFESATNWRIEGSADGTSWTPLYSSTHLLPGNTITTVTWNNSTAYSYYRFYGVSSQGSSLNPGLSLFQLLGDRTPSPSQLTVQVGSGQIVLTGANTYSGTTTISTGILQIGNGGATGTPGTGAITNHSSLKINCSNEVTFSGIISGSGTLTQQGTGKTILPAANTYTGSTTVEAGQLMVSGSLTSAVTVKSGALLSSGVNGIIYNTVRVETGGRIQGGSEAPGTLTINGPLTLQNSVVLNVYSSNATVSKIITSSRLVPGALTVNLKTPMTAGTYTLLEASGSHTTPVTAGENNSTLDCVNYSWGTPGLQLIAIVDIPLSGGGTLSSPSSSGLSVWLRPSQSGVTYTLYRTVNNVTSTVATREGTGATLTFDNPGAGVYTLRGSKGACLRQMSGSVTITTDATAIKNGLAKNYIPEAVKVSLTGEVPKDKAKPYYLGELFPSFQAPVIGDCNDPGYFYAGFQLSYDGSDQNTVAGWAAQLSISLVKGATTTKLTDSLKVDLGTQTFETTTFFKDSIRCLDNYQFKINSKTVKGQVPAGSVRLFIRLYKVPSARPEMLPTAVISNLNGTQTGNTVQLGWLNTLSGVDEYDLEWTFIDYYDNYTPGHAAAAFTFQEPARITLKGLEYTHQVYYPRGKIYYRIRPVGRPKNNPIQRIEGAWTYKEAPVEITNHSPGRTWQQQTLFAEEGKYKKVMSYYDATGRLRQQQTNLSSENSTLTTETMYDFEGRQALTLMPVPERGNSLLYKSNLNPFIAGPAVQPFTSATQKKYHYDNGRLANSRLDSAATGGAGRYYSANNTLPSLHQNYLPKAAGYAYTQTEYTRDGTGRISRQSGLGPELTIDGPHAMRYYYGSAAPEELTRLFGEQVGKAAHYKKDVVVDANGQATVTYKDQEGRTIATALAGAPPANVENLTSYPNQATAISQNLTEKNSKKNGLSETIHTFINVSPNSAMTINYTWSARGVQLPMLPPQCTSCAYQLTLELTDPNGAKVSLGNATGDEDPGPSYRKTRTALSCSANADTTMQFTPVVLAEVGDYTLRKTLTPTLLTYQQLRETVKQLPSTVQYRETIRVAHPAKYDACQDCETCNKDSLINAAIREIAQRKCQRIRDTLEANYKRNYVGSYTLDEYLNHESSNKLICKYNYCNNTIESSLFDTQLAMIKDWTAAVSKNLSTLASVMAADPFFLAANRQSLMTTKMGQVGIPQFPYDSNGYEDKKKEKKETRDIVGPLDAVTNPSNPTYYLDEYGRESASGKHFLYYDLKEKLEKQEITQEEYAKRLDQQRWALFRQYYSEGKRQIKLEETLGCDSMQAELRKQEALPKTDQEIIQRAKQNTDADQWIMARMTFLAFKSSCAPQISRPDSTAITQMLFNYFKSTPYNYMGVIDEKDSAIDPATNKCKNPHLEAVRERLEANYSRCRLADFATQNPVECLQDTTVYIDEPEPSLPASSAPMMMSRTTGGTDGEELIEREMEEERMKERTRKMEEEWEERREEERKEREEKEENIGGNAFRPTMASTPPPLTPVAEVNALIDLYNSTQGNQWSNTGRLWYPAKSGTMPYVTASADISNWQGISLDAEGHVVALSLPSNNLMGPLPVGLSACTRLKSLRLEINQLTGSISVLGQLPNLETVDLDRNLLSGSLPNLSACTRLKWLSIRHNRLSGSLDVLGQLPNLETVDLDRNLLSGSLPNLSACTRLKWLSIRHNRLSGSLDVLGQLPNLEGVDLVRNQLSGSLSNLSACTRLKWLYIEDNQLSGSLDVLGQLPNLEGVDLARNLLSGSLPNFSACTKLKQLYLYMNQLTGSLSALGQLPNLESVSLARNQLSGSLSNLSACTKLERLYMSNNQLSGSLSNLSACTKLEDLYMSNNQLSGILPNISAWPELEGLSISGNKFTFTDLEGLAVPTFTPYDFFYFSQATVDTEQAIPFNPGTPITLTTSIDRNTTTPCKYRWFKKTGNVETPLNAESVTGHTCSFTPQSADRGAEFYYTITNSNFPYLTLTSRVRKLKLLKPYTYCLKYRLHPDSKTAKLWDFDLEAQKRKCRTVQDSIAVDEVNRLVNQYIEEKTSQLLIKSDSTCLKNAVETLGITYTNKEHHYTLYYYDQAGNLVQTVPPQGVQIATTGNPAHTLKTTYRYNAQNQVVEQTTPDAGTSRFYYNKKGQLRFSQNAQQVLDGSHAYTKYDAQGRIIETGEATQIDLAQIEDSLYPKEYRTDVTYTHYDAPARRSPLNQKYLRSRVSYTETIEKDATDTTRTYYSYDPHGSVNILLQKLPGLPPKTTHYRYDLVSGKVNYVFYQYKKPDQFVHRYTYDSDNRIREVFTSADRYVWHKDATYRYYLHGPLATTELGHWRNQALNYTYTLQGWIKGVNTIETTDNKIGQSVMSYQLGYYKNDYRPIGATQNNVTLWTRANETLTHQGMYNGNISWMETGLKLFKKPQAMLYKYDQLNRITKSRSLEFSNGDYAARTGDKKYDENYSYDANGNILTLNRKDDKAGVMDDFNYSYYPNSNKLQRHKTTGATYEYDAIGNLVKDNNENLEIAWTPSGKVRSVSKSDSIILFRYDATGNRIAKIIVSTTAKNDTTIYVRDASGNVMSIYNNRTVSEVPIYGSSRIGEYMGKEREGYQTFNLRKYELSNHLGNVLVVISDKVKLYSRNKVTLDSARAEVVSASDYYPFGLAMKGRSFNSTDYRFGFNGKEKDKEADWYYFGARYYNPKIGKFLSIDRFADKYADLTPYHFGANNPLTYIDINGDSIIAPQAEAQQMIRNTLTKEDAKFVKFDKNGRIDNVTLNAHVSKSENYSDLRKLENSRRHVNVLLDQRYTSADDRGRVTTSEMAYQGPDPENADPNSVRMNGTSTGEGGLMGVTLLPGRDPTAPNSPNNSVHIIINRSLSNEARAEMYSHEANGHALIFIKTGNIDNASHDYGDTGERNIYLQSEILKSKHETITNRK